jgi:putative DNA primase/helicase
MMPSAANILKNFLPARLLRRRESSVPQPKVRVSLVPIDLKDFLALEVAPRAMLLDPILPERSLSMLYAPRGIGKSWLGLSIGLAVASGGSLLRWMAPRPRRVLYVDGEMPLPDIQARLAAIMAGLGGEIANNRFHIVAADNTEGGINLSNEDGQRALDAHLEGVDLLILDNLSTLLANGSEGASDSWLPIQNWLLRLRRKGIAVLIIHHAGVNGKQRGTSRREDALDTVIGLRRPPDYAPEQGARFEVHMEKLRQLAGEGALPFEAAVESFPSEDGKPGIRWVAGDLAAPVFHRAAELFAAGHTVRQVAVLLGISRSEAGRQRQRAEAEGLLGPERQVEDEEIEAVLEGTHSLN